MALNALVAALAAAAFAAPPAQAVVWYPPVVFSDNCEPCEAFMGMAADGTVIRAYHGAFGGAANGVVIPMGDQESGLVSTPLTEHLSSVLDLSVNAAGDALVALAARNADNTTHFGTVERRNGVWQPFRTLPGDPSHALVSVALADSGRAVVAWEEFEPDTPTRLRAATRTAAGVWSAASTIATDGTGSPEAALDTTGAATVAWLDSPAATLKAAHRPATGTWSAVRELGGAAFAPGASHAPFEFRLASRGSGRAIALVVSRDRVEGLSRAVYSTQLASGTWSEPVLHDSGAFAEDGTGTPPSRPRLDVNAAGAMVAAWAAGREVHAAGAPAGQPLGAVSKISEEDQLNVAPAVAISDDGSALIAWADDRVVNTVARPAGGTFEPIGAIPQQPRKGFYGLAADAEGRFAAAFSSDTRMSARSRPPVAILRAPVDPATGVTLRAVRGQPYRLTATDSFDPDRPDAAAGGIVSHAWDLDADGAFDDASGATEDATFDTSGGHPVAVRVTDNTGDVRVGRIAIDVAGLTPTASFAVSPPNPLTQEPVTLTSTTSAPPGADIQLLQWETNGPFLGYDDASGPTASATYPLPGTYTVGLQVTTSENAQATATQALTIGNRPPLPEFTATEAPIARTLVDFSASSSSDPDPPPGVGLRRFEWDLDGDGSFETDQGAAPEAVASYSAAGTINVGLRVTDAYGGSATLQRPLAVQPAAAALQVGSTGAGFQARTVAAIAAKLAAGARRVRFRAPRAGVLGVRFEARGSRRLLASTATVFRRGGIQVVRVRMTPALRRARFARVRVTWTPRGGRGVTVTRALRGTR